MNWIIYALVAYACVSAANITDKYLVDKHIKDSSVIVLFTGSVAFITGLVVYILRGFPVLSADQLILVILAGVFLEIYLLPYFRALEADDVSLVVPLFQVIPVFALIFSYIFLKEILSVRQYIGFIFILLSGLGLSLNSRLSGFRLKKTFWLMMLSSMLFASSTVLFKFVVDLNNVWDAIAYEGMGIGLGTLMIFAWPGYLRRFLKYTRRLKLPAWGALTTSETFYIAYRLLLAIALSLGPVSLINVIGGFQPVFVFIYSIFLSLFIPSILKETFDRKIIGRKLIALTGIFIGLYFVYVV